MKQVMKQAIDDDLDDDVIGKECDDCNAYSKRYLDVIWEVKQKINKRYVQVQPDLQIRIDIKQGYKLPKIELSIFSEKLTDWLGF